MYINSAAWACCLGLLLTGCAQSPNARITAALESKKAVIISPLLPTGNTSWKLVGQPDTGFELGSSTDAKIRIGSAYQMVVVEPGTYRLSASSSYAGQGQAHPRLVTNAVVGRLGRVWLLNDTYREPYTTQRWQDRVTQQVVIPTTSYCASQGANGTCLQWGYNQGGIINQVVQQEGYRNETHYKDPVATLNIGLGYDTKDPLAWLEAKAGEVLLINLFEPALSDIGYDDQHCTPEDDLKNTYVCPFNRLRMGIPPINLGFFKADAKADPPIDSALLDKVKPYYIKLNGVEVGRNDDQRPIVEFGSVRQNQPTSPPPAPTRAKANTKAPAKK